MAHVEVSEITVTEVTIESPPRPRSLVASVEAWLGLLVEIPAAILVVAEIVILFAGVIARYVLHQPLIWSDELASMLFLWLAFGSLQFLPGQIIGKTWIILGSIPLISLLRRRDERLGLAPA